jgi:hypothetical protein
MFQDTGKVIEMERDKRFYFIASTPIEVKWHGLVYTDYFCYFTGYRDGQACFQHKNNWRVMKFDSRNAADKVVKEIVASFPAVYTGIEPSVVLSRKLSLFAKALWSMIRLYMTTFDRCVYWYHRLCG